MTTGSNSIPAGTTISIIFKLLNSLNADVIKSPSIYLSNSGVILKSFSTKGLPILPSRIDAALDTAIISFLIDTFSPSTLTEINPSNARLSISVPPTLIENSFPAADVR